jgi:hypothetical protein
MDRKDVAFWFAVGLFSIGFLASFKILAAQKWAPDGLTKLAAFL